MENDEEIDVENDEDLNPICPENYEFQKQSLFPRTFIVKKFDTNSLKPNVLQKKHNQPPPLFNRCIRILNNLFFIEYIKCRIYAKLLLNIKK